MWSFNYHDMTITPANPPFPCYIQLLDGVLAALLEPAKTFASEQMRADSSKITWSIDGRKDVEELVERNALPRPNGLGSRGRSGQTDGVGEASFGFREVSFETRRHDGDYISCRAPV